MRSVCSTLIVLLTASIASVPSAAAQDGFVDELRFGGTWAQPEAIDSDHPERNQAGINGEILFAPLNFDSRAGGEGDFLNAILTPRFHVGGTVNFSDEGTSYGYAGLTWHFGLTERLFVETSFGAAVNNGKKNGELNAAGNELVRARLGSNVTFRESVALGFNVTESMTVLLQLDHNSHARLFDEKNRGLTATHLKFGYKF